MSDSLQPHRLQRARPPCPSYLLEFAQFHVHWVSDAIQPSHPLPTLLLLLSVFPSIRVSCSELSVRIRWPKCWSFSLQSFSISPSNEYSEFISFSINWFDLLAVQETLKDFCSTSVQKHHFFGAQPSVSSKSHIRTWLLKKAMALTIRTIVGKEMSLLFNILSRFVITFLPGRKGLLIKSSFKKNSYFIWCLIFKNYEYLLSQYNICLFHWWLVLLRLILF